MQVELKPTSEIKARLGIQPNGPVQRYFQNACYRYMDKYVPYRRGNLRKNVDLSDPNYIVYQSPYAHYMYEGKTMVDAETGSAWARRGTRKVYDGGDITYHTAGTGPHWDKRMVSAEMNDLVNEVQDFVMRGGK